MKTILIKNGRLIDSASKRDEVVDILIEAGKISKIAKGITEAADKVIEAKNKIVMPGLIDMHVHLREPGREDKETIRSGTKAALKGGVTSVLAMPNTSPTIDSLESIKLLRNIIEKDAKANVLLCAAITKQRKGEELTDIASFKKEGVVAITDDGSSVDDQDLMKDALRKAEENNLLVICHCEDKSLSKNGVVNHGFTSTRMGLRGISNESEYKAVKRDIELAAKLEAKVHIAHVSCRESVEIISEAKKKGVRVSAETAPHYFSLTESSLLGFDTNKKMNPPLRSEDDRKSIVEGLVDGTIDVIACDHAPHTENEKDIEFDRAEFGVIGLETELAVAITELIDKGLLSWSDLVDKMAYNPAKILGINKGTLKIGADADIIVVSPQEEWTVEKQGVISKSKNSCFLGKKVKGVVDYTIYKGNIAYTSGQ